MDAASTARAPQTHGTPADAPDLREYGAEKNGARQSTDRRLFMQLVVLSGAGDTAAIAAALQNSGLESVLYADLSDARGIGILFMSEDPALFTNQARALLNSPALAGLSLRQEFTMTGRTYATGFEQELEDWLLRKPRRNVFNKELDWHVWYPLRRAGAFELLSKEEQRPILMEHARLGMAYGQAGLAHDVRLACHGLDAHDNEFVLGLVSRDLGAISRLVQDMRKTQQTSRYIQQMGPFFIGRVLSRNAFKIY